MKQTLIALACVLFASSAFAGKFADISISELETAISQGNVVLIDVNGSESYANGHIPGAINYSAAKADLASQLGTDKDKLVVAYCGGPSCAAYKKAAKAAEKAGFTNVKHLSAGISGWIEAGKTVEKS